MNETFSDFDKLRENNTNIRDVFLNQYQDWPPHPLISNDFNNVKFQILDDKATIYPLHRIVSVLKSRAALIKRLPRLISLEISKILKELDTPHPLYKAMAYLMCFLLLPFLIMHYFLFSKLTSRGEFETCGFVMPGINRHIYLNKKLDFEVMSILGHECVHLLQNNAAGNFDLIIENKEFIENQRESGLFCEGDEYRVLREYLFNRMEIEARFHECMVFYYRYKKILPITKLDFLSVLFSFKFSNRLKDILMEYPESSAQFKLINKIIKNSKNNKIPVGSIEVYSNLSSEMEFLLVCFKSHMLVLTEYFPNCYERLLILYGDTSNSLKFKLSQV